MEYIYIAIIILQANKEDVLVPSDPQEDKWLRRELKEGGFEDDTASELDKKLVEITKQLYSEFKEDISSNFVLYYVNYQRLKMKRSKFNLKVIHLIIL